MSHTEKTHQQLLDEIGALRDRLSELERADAQRRQAEEALRHSERRFRALIENGCDAIALIDAQGVVRYASPSTCRVLGYTPEEFTGRNLFELMHPEDEARVGGLFAELLGRPGLVLASQFRYRHKDGSWRWIEGSGTNLLDEPDVRAIVANYRDVTPRRRLEEERAMLAAQLGGAPAGPDGGALLPVCAWCKQVRDEDGRWVAVEAYLVRRTGAGITHGICPDCFAKTGPPDPAP
jgi:PAS domain S-box-containing protein